jgi:protein-disulfide isomerase
VIRDFPLESIHPQAFRAAEASYCANEQDKYWEMHDRLFANQKELGVKDLPRHAKALGMDATQFQQCLESGKYAARIRKDLAEGQTGGVIGTPGFFLGVTDPTGTDIIAPRLISGAQPYDAFKRAIDSLLAEQK